jgi:putative oxidoreductase
MIPGVSDMTLVAAPTSRYAHLLAVVDHAIALLDRAPYALLALPLRVGAATVFWNSAMAKLAS